MKKQLYVVLLLMCIILLSGCDKKKTLTCSKTEKSTGMNISTTTTTNFVNDKISTVKMDMSVKLDSNYTKYSTTIKNSLENQYADYKQSKGVTYSTTAKGDLITFTMTIDNKVIDKKTREGLKLTGSETYESNKKTLESNGYTCK